ncbi:MAG: carboxymuconolactone decarboxylase family protein [Pseudomonadota bacterium]|nr:carboxymuconolactone decarboxylase family protein [Pseudomonadota bacterium]
MSADHTDNERYQRGIKKLQELTAANDYNPAEHMLETINRVAPDVSRYSMEFVLGDILSRPGLDTKTREMLNVAVLTAIQAPIELKLHINIALNAGVTREEISEIITQQVVYVGFPIAINGLHAAAEVFEERDARGINP